MEDLGKKITDLQVIFLTNQCSMVTVVLLISLWVSSS